MISKNIPPPIRTLLLTAGAFVFAARLLAQTAPVVPPAPAEPLAPGSVTITVGREPRQVFQGLGAGENHGIVYDDLPVAKREKLSDLLWRDLRFNTIRIWFPLKRYAPAPGARDLDAGMRPEYRAMLADAGKRGVTHLLLAPSGVPDYLLERPVVTRKDGTSGPGSPRLKVESRAEHAAIIADFIRDLRDRHGIRIGVTGVQNEPNTGHDCNFTPEAMVESVKLLRAALDSRGLRDVRIVAPETASADRVSYDMVDALKADPAAWKALAGIATHSYNMAGTEIIARKIEGENKEYWQTESSVPGPEEQGDVHRASAMATTFLSDMNHRVTHWIHFIGFLQNDPRDNGTRIIAYDPKGAGDEGITIFHKYHYFQQLSRTFDVGAVARKSISSLEKDMTWTYGKKPRITAAAAKNPDGSWGIGISNYTSNDFPKRNQFHIDNSGRPAQTFAVTVKIEELATAGDSVFEVHRSGPALTNAHKEPVTLRGGQVTLTVAPYELVTLRSAMRR